MLVYCPFGVLLCWCNVGEGEIPPPCFAMDGNKTQRIRAVISIDGPSMGEEGGVTWGKWQQTNDFEFNNLNSDIHRPTLTVFPMINVQHSMKRGGKDNLREGDHCQMTKD